MGRKAPNMMVVCLLKTRAGILEYEETHARDAQDNARYMSWLWRKGVYWAGGPVDGGRLALHIYSVDSVEKAKGAQRNAPDYKSGFLYDDEYFEWTPTFSHDERIQSAKATKG